MFNVNKKNCHLNEKIGVEQKKVKICSIDRFVEIKDI